MLWFLFIPLSLAAIAQDELDLSSIQRLNEELPSYYVKDLAEKEFAEHRQFPEHHPLPDKRRLSKILNSGTKFGSIREGLAIIDISSNRAYKLSKQIYVSFFKLEDEFGYRYIQNKDGSYRYKIKSDSLVTIAPELVLHEPPRHYTMAPKDKAKNEFDKNFRLSPEVIFYTGIVEGDFMEDLLDDPKVNKGISTQYGAHFFTNWDHPIKIGGAIHYERTEYRLTNNGFLTYSSLSFGPQFKTKDFDLKYFTTRLQTQYRLSPYAIARAHVRRANNSDFKFNSSDWLTSVEFPIKNSWGEFVLSFYGQYQWLSIKEQRSNLDLETSNNINKSWGVAFAQVF